MRRGTGSTRKAFLRRAAGGAAMALALSYPALAAPLLPADFFDSIPSAPEGQAAIEADFLSYDGARGVVTASGRVNLSYSGYQASGDELVYEPKTGAVKLTGNVRMRDPAGNVYLADAVDVTGGLQQAFLRAVALRAANGALITADSVDYSRALESVLVNSAYSPCGECVDAKGRRIGWKVSAARITYNNQSKMIYLEQPRLDVLGIPVAWLPWIGFPDPTQKGLENFRFPTWAYSDKIGVQLNLPYQVSVTNDTDIIFTPSINTRQGLMGSLEVVQRFQTGEASVKGSIIRQADPAAFAGEVGNREWRGAIQTSGRFTTVENWTAGWSYTAFTDAAFQTDYQMTAARNYVNEVYATHLSDDFFFDVRAAQYNLLGNYTAADQDKQASALPLMRFETVQKLQDGYGQLEFTARLANVSRNADHVSTVNGVKYAYGFKESKQHLMLQGGWQNQMIAPGGLLVTPYLGARADASAYDGASTDVSAPAGAMSLLAATPIAALDVRFPMMAQDDYGGSHIFEPIGQLVYRGSNTTAVGITNDDAQSFVFDDTNLFSYNRFTGTDRQETGLRANVGARYQANFANGGYVDAIVGQSFHLAGTNALGVPDAAQTGTMSGLHNNASYIVAGARAGFEGLDVGAKLQVDPVAPRITRAGAGAAVTLDTLTFGGDYLYIAANPALGVPKDQHEVYGYMGIPIDDYWRLTAGAGWDLNANSFLIASAGVSYDDGYFMAGVEASRTGPTHSSPNDTRVTGSFRLKTPDWSGLGLTQTFSPKF